MKKIRSALLVFGATVAAACSAAVAVTAAAATLEVTVQNVKGNEGNLMLAVYDATGYQKNPVRALQQRADTPNFRIADLPEGDYAIAVYHDRNANGKLDANMMGMPTEPYGFSQNARGSMGPPSFADAKFGLPTAGLQLSIDLSR